MDDVATSGWLTVVESGSDTCPLVVNGMRTRGPIRGRHVSLVVWVVVIIVVCKMYGVRGVQPPDFPTAQTLIQTPITNRATTHTLIYICFGFYLKPLVGIVGAATGPGLAQPLVARFSYIYMTTCIYIGAHAFCNMVSTVVIWFQQL
jgi:hypothetical protein